MKIRGNRIYDEYGRLQGRVRDNGRIVDQYGRAKGKIRDSGRVVDESGQQLGKVRNSKIYDGYGRPMEPDVLFADDQAGLAVPRRGQEAAERVRHRYGDCQYERLVERQPVYNPANLPPLNQNIKPQRRILIIRRDGSVHAAGV